MVLSGQSFDRQDMKAAAMALSLCLKTEVLVDKWVWDSDLPRIPGVSPRMWAVRSAVLETLITNIPFPVSLTERRRLLETLLPVECENFRRSNLLTNAISDLIRFVGNVPSVRLEHFRQWRVLCHYGDEEVLVAAAIGEFLFRVEGNGLADSAADLWDLASLFSLNWGSTLVPVDPDVSHLLSKVDSDAHLHFGQLLPSKVLWLLLMQGHYSPEFNEASENPLLETVANSTAVGADSSLSCGPEWIRKGYREWRERRKSLVMKIDEFGAMWSSHVNRSKFPGSEGPLAATWEDAGACPSLPFLSRFILAERILLICGYYIARVRENAEETFWKYIAARVGFTWQQVPRESGFESFQRTQDLDRAKGYKWGKTGDTTVWCQLVVAWLDATGIRNVDVRHNIRAGQSNANANDSLNEIQAAIDAIVSAHRTLANGLTFQPTIKYNVALSVNRSTNDSWNVSFGRRNSEWRALRQSIDALADAWFSREGGVKSEEGSGIIWRINAVDLISSEFGFDAGIAAPAFHRFRRETSLGRLAADQSDRRNEAGLAATVSPPLCRYYHTGEDWEHPVTALRTLWEAIEWFDLHVSDRLGHVSVLFRVPEDFEMNESLGERLDNFTSLWWIVSRRRHILEGRDGEVLNSIRLELEECHRQVHELAGVHVSHSDLCDGWHMRARSEDEILGISRHRPNLRTVYWGFAGQPENNQEGFDSSLAYRDRINDAYKRRGERLRGVYKSEWWDILRRVVVAEIRQRGISIETCPSSNLIISGGWLADLPTLGLVDLGLSPQLVVGSDDPKMLKTDAKVEVSLIAASLASRLGRRPAIQDFMSQMVRNPVSNCIGDAKK